MRQNDRRTITFRRAYAEEVEAKLCAQSYLTFDEWVRMLIRKEVARAGLTIEEPRPGRKPADAELPGQQRLPLMGPENSFDKALREQARRTTIERGKAVLDSLHKKNLEAIDKYEPVPDGGVGSIIDDPPFTEPPPSAKDEDESELDAHDREINEKLKELQGGRDDTEPF